MREIHRILDANFNRAREALRVIEDCGRFVLNDPAITAMAKHFRSDLKDLLDELPYDELITSRDTPGDVGRELSSPGEIDRQTVRDVATAACKRLTEALRTIEEYSKILAPKVAESIERMRYDAYTLEQRLTSRFLTAERFAEVKLYAMISASLCRNASLREVARGAVAGGAEALQLREKDSHDDVFLAMAAELRELTDETGKLLIINDRPDIAAIVGADGVHLGQNDLPISEARKLLRPDAIIGRSTHSLAEAKSAINEGADYIAVGPIFETRTKDYPTVGPELLSEIMAEVSLPVVAVGGITSANAGQLVSLGARCVAVCGDICNATNPKAATQTLSKLLP